VGWFAFTGCRTTEAGEWGSMRWYTAEWGVLDPPSQPAISRNNAPHERVGQNRKDSTETEQVPHAWGLWHAPVERQTPGEEVQARVVHGERTMLDSLPSGPTTRMKSIPFLEKDNSGQREMRYGQPTSLMAGLWRQTAEFATMQALHISNPA
jgi:hypothetical protein